MGKTVKLDDQVHKDLEELRAKRETFSGTVARLINFYRQITRVAWSHDIAHPHTPGQGA